MFDKILDNIAKKTKIDDITKRRIKNFPKVKNRLINMTVKGGVISEGKLRAINNFITFFGCGKIKNGPGTFASFTSILLWLAVTVFFIHFHFSQTFELIFWGLFLSLIFFYSLILIPIYSRDLKDDDHPSIVIDEVVGQILTLCLTYPFIREYYYDKSWFLTKIIMFTHMFLCFILFRVLDIAKPFFIGWADENIKGPFGVMFDDIIAGIVAAAINITFFLFYKSSILQLHGY